MFAMSSMRNPVVSIAFLHILFPKHTPAGARKQVGRESFSGFLRLCVELPSSQENRTDAYAPGAVRGALTNVMTHRRNRMLRPAPSMTGLSSAPDGVNLLLMK